MDALKQKYIEIINDAEKIKYLREVFLRWIICAVCAAE